MSGARAKQASERSRHPTEIRRQLIVEAARSVIAERGLFATSIRDIAAAGNVSIGTVTYHFTGIADILAEVLIGEMDSFYAPVIAAATAAPDGRAALRRSSTASSRRRRGPESAGRSGWTSGRCRPTIGGTRAASPRSTSTGAPMCRPSSIVAERTAA